MYLLDSDVVAELRHARAGRTDAGLAAWADGVPRLSLFMSALSLLELEGSVVRQQRRNQEAGQALANWIETQVLPAFDGRILPVDAAIVRRRARLPYDDDRNGLLAATALEHGLTLVTRQVGSFRQGRVKLLNPWGFSPDELESEADWRQAARTGPLWLKNLFVRT